MRSPIPLPPGEGAWLLLSVGGGGFDGKGPGVVAANSSGDVVAAPPFSPPKVLQGAADSLKARALKGCGHDPAGR